jgi:hypothetical protein
MKRLFAIALLISAMVLVGSQPTNADILKDLKDLADKIGKVAPLAMKDEDVGSLFAQSVEEKYGLDQNPERNTKVQQIGSKILSINKIAGKYDFAVLASRDFNACSIYGGHVRVNEGLLTDTQNNDAEAAFVIAHEIAHNELGHNKESVKNFRIAHALDLASITEKMPKLLVMGANAVMAKRSRENESAADLQGIKYMAQAGYKITGAIAMARRIEAEHTIAQKRSGNNLATQRFNAIFATHPEPAKRAAMAEDELFMQKYGSTFKQVAGGSDSRLQPIGLTNNRLTGNLPIIMAHASKWEVSLATPREISGMGIFNSANILGGNDIDDLTAYFSLLGQGKALCLTCDNDTHAPGTPGPNMLFTYINVNSVDKGSLLQAIREGRTYATKYGVRICEENFQIGSSYPKTEKVSWNFKLDLPTNFLTAPKIKVFRGNKEVAELEKINSSFERQPEYRFEDKNLKPGLYWYVLAIPGQLITSPITVEITGNPNDKPVVNSNWCKGIVHFHSIYSDNICSTLKGIALSCRTNDVEFIFMTDHADDFTDEAQYQRYINECRQQSPLMIPGVEWPLTDVKLTRHLLILGLEKYIKYEPMSEEDFFAVPNTPDQVCIIRDQFHIGDDISQTEMEKDALFGFSKSAATLKMWIKGSPFKDPIIWINRHEIGRVVTTDNKWHLYTFQVPADYLNNGQNLYHMESFIPDRWHTFDDCEVKDIWIVKN